MLVIIFRVSELWSEVFLGTTEVDKASSEIVLNASNETV